MDLEVMQSWSMAIRADYVKPDKLGQYRLLQLHIRTRGCGKLVCCVRQVAAVNFPEILTICRSKQLVTVIAMAGTSVLDAEASDVCCWGQLVGESWPSITSLSQPKISYTMLHLIFS